MSSSKETVRERIYEIKEAGIQNIMALRGDIPKDLIGADRSNWDYQHAIDLIRELKEANPDFCIGAACYPEIHPESSNQKEDIKWLKEKVDVGCDFLTTTYFTISFIKFEKQVLQFLLCQVSCLLQMQIK